MATFTRPDGTKITIASEKLARARPTIRREIYGHPEHVGSALFNPKQLVMEPIEYVGRTLKDELRHFCEFHAPNGASIWINSEMAGDAEKPRSTEKSNNTNSVILIGGVRQRLSESVVEAQAKLDDARK